MIVMAQNSSGTLAERYDRGVRLRKKAPREKHADLLGRPRATRWPSSAVADRTRVPDLVPVRYERMLAKSVRLPARRRRCHWPRTSSIRSPPGLRCRLAVTVT